MSYELCRLTETTLKKCDDVLRTEFWNAEPYWISEAAFTLLIVNLKDALSALDKMKLRIIFTDDINSKGDVTDLVREMRNAAAHNGSVLRLVDPIRQNGLSFGVCVGRANLAKFDDIELKNEYDDDIAFFHGALRILLVRHIVRAVREAKQNLRTAAAAHDYWIFTY
ncbi:hypothetical protein [Pararhizobium qamdonense]|uniref:hypothetical protein n=1 Tax=Pararhizobium qamdonense TaxID=3031126 RepID=UPI0023E22028|nr:hypothetical protein [Pararhizobium qamdonense]